MEFERAEFVDRVFEDGKEKDGKESRRGSASGSALKSQEGPEKSESPAPAEGAPAEGAPADVKDEQSKDDAASHASESDSRPPSQEGNKRRPKSTSSAGMRGTVVKTPRSEGGQSETSEKSQGSAPDKDKKRHWQSLKDRRSQFQFIKGAGRGTSRGSHWAGGVEVFQKPAMAGLLLDFVPRLAAEEGKEGLMENVRHVSAKAEKFLKDTFEREELMSQFMDAIITYNKSTENLGKKEKPWPKTTPMAMRSQIKTIVENKRQAKCLFAEVHNWLLKYKLFHSYVKEQFETIDERRNRMEEFWHHYHARCRRNELPPIAMEAATNGGDGTPREKRPKSPSNALLNETRRKAVLERNSKSTLALPEGTEQKLMRSDTKKLQRSDTTKISLTAEEQWSMIDSIEAKEEDYSSPKAGRRKMAKSSSSPDFGPSKYGMRWNAEAMSMKWTPVDPAPGTRESKGESLYQHKQLQLHSTGGGFGAALTKRDKKPKRGALPSLDASGSMGPMALQQTETSTDKYLEACQRCWIVPMPLPFITGHSFRLSAKGRDMKDADLRAVTVMIHDSFSFAECDLCGNSKLTEKALVPFIHRLFGEPCTSTLQRLALSDCKNVGLGTLNMTIRLLSEKEGARSLRALELSRVRITPKSHLELAKAVHRHPHLEELHLQDTNLGATVLAKQCLEEIFQCKSLHYLDLSWNCFDPDEFSHLGAQLVEYDRIKTMKLANCSSAVTGLSNPITYFLEQLSHDEGLTNLDISINRMDFRAALIIEDCFQNHKQIRELNISENPFGVQGMRSALRLLSRSSSGLTHFECKGCFNGRVFAEDPNTPAQVFNMSNPGGRYTLDLEKPYHRSLLRMLYKTTESFGVQHEETFFKIVYSKGAYTHPVKDSDGVWMVPEVGKLAVTYNIEKALEAKLKGVKEDDFADFLEKHAEIMKWTPGFTKAIPLFATFKLMEGQTVDQNGFIEALSKDFRFPPAYLQQMFNSCSSLRMQALLGLLPCVSGGVAARSLSMFLVPTIGEAIKMIDIMQMLLDFFNPQNPTGHYKLNLDLPGDYAVGQQLLLLDRWEVVIGKRQGRIDTSQRGNNSRFRNEHYQGRPLCHEYSSISEWSMPECDIFEFDYTSAKRPPADARVLGEEVYEKMLVDLADSPALPEMKVMAIRQVSHHFYINALQMREMLGAFKEESMRAEAFIALYLRVVDVYNAKIFVVRFAEEAEKTRLKERLGYATFFPFIQPENAKFDLDFSFHDQRLCANLFMMLAAKEGTHNIRDPSYIHASGYVDPLPLGVPRSWEKLKDCPTGGVFKGMYACSPDSRRFALRKQLCEQFGLFQCDVAEEEVMWWTGLMEPPEDVLDFLEFLMCRYPDAKDGAMLKAFKEIDGEEGNGVITLREFEEGVLQTMACKKFKGKDEAKRLDALFRYLDPGGEGSVSQEEFFVLNQLWKEFDLSITEFVHYLQRQFGDDLAEAWAYLDDDDSGELTLEEWVKAVEDIGFFGPSAVVFGLLDNSDDGSISLDEFEVLEKYKKKPKS